MSAANLQDEPSSNTADAMANARDGNLLLPGPHLLSPRKVLPNLITCLATCVGMSSVVAAQAGHLQLAVLCIIGAGILDGLDGPAARALNSTSRFGAELDSISDVINFGVMPALLIYESVLKKGLGLLGWPLSIVFTVAVSCRLARFNAGVDFNASKSTKNFFMGVPAPTAAAIAAIPLMIRFTNEQVQSPLLEVCYKPEVVAAWNVFSAFLAVTRLPTFSSKAINKELLARTFPTSAHVLGAFAAVAALLWVSRFHLWALLAGGLILYVLSTPVAFIVFKAVMQADKRQARTRDRGSTAGKRRSTRSRSPSSSKKLS